MYISVEQTHPHVLSKTTNKEMALEMHVFHISSIGSRVQKNVINLTHKGWALLALMELVIQSIELWCNLAK